MNNFDYSNFDKIYDTKINPELTTIEEERKKLYNIYIIAGIILIVSFLFQVMLIPFFVIFIYAGIRYAKYKQEIKNKFYKILFNSIGFEYEGSMNRTSIFSVGAELFQSLIKKSSTEKINEKINEITKFIYNTNVIYEVCKISDIFYRYDFIKIDDKISGSYKNLPFTVLDSYIYYETGDSDGGKTKEPMFMGLILATKINKPLYCDILIKADKFLQAKEINDKKVVRLEDPEFEKYFEVYATDQVEARYVLTTAFMDRLLHYRKIKNKKVEVFLSNKVSNENNLFFFIHTNKDNFEVPIFHTILDKQMFLNIIKELTDILDIINELKLEQNIGL